MATTIATACKKGGIGKTSVCVHTAELLAASGLRVGVIDLDPQGNCSRRLLGYSEDEVAAWTYPSDAPHVLRALEGDRGGALTQFVPTAEPWPDNLLLLPSPGMQLETFNRTNAMQPDRRLRRAMVDVAEALDLDVVFIDTPPSLALLTQNAFTCADLVLPIGIVTGSRAGLAETMSSLEVIQEDRDVRVPGPVLTAVPSKLAAADQAALEALRRVYPDLLTIPHSTIWRTAETQGQPLSSYAELRDGRATAAANALDALRPIVAALGLQLNTEEPARV